EEASWLEHALSLRPDAQDTRFQLAYLYADIGNNTLALFHYTKLSETDPRPHVLNNLGVTRGALGLKARAIDAYTRSSAQGHTLAMANRAQLLLDAGFLDEAFKIVREAEQLEGVHENVASVRAAIESTREDESEKER